MQAEQRYIFVRGKTSMSNREKLIVLTLVSFFLAVFFWISYWELLKPEDIKKVLEPSSNRAGLLNMFLPMILTLLFLIFVQLTYRKTRLIVDNKGMFLEWPRGSVFAKFKFLEKRVAWTNLQHATHLSSFEAVQLRSKGSSLPWGIRLRDWKIYSVEIPQDALRDKKIDLLSVLREQGIFETVAKDPRLLAMEFDLMKHPVTRKILLVTGVLLAYCFVDVFTQHEGWAFFNEDYLLPHIAIAFAATAVLARAALKADKQDQAPIGITVVVLAIAGISFLVTSYVSGIRLNQLVGGPLISAEYHRDDKCEKLIPVENNLPVVEYTSMTKDYWCSVKADEVVMVKVRKGLFGLYQFDLREQTMAIRDYKQKS